MLIAHSSSLLSTSDLRHPTSWSLRDVEPDAESCSVGARGWPSPYPLAAQAHRRAAPVRRPLPAELAPPLRLPIRRASPAESPLERARAAPPAAIAARSSAWPRVLRVATIGTRTIRN